MAFESDENFVEDLLLHLCFCTEPRTDNFGEFGHLRIVKKTLAERSREDYSAERRQAAEMRRLALLPKVDMRVRNTGPLSESEVEALRTRELTRNRAYRARKIAQQTLAKTQ